MQQQSETISKPEEHLDQVLSEQRDTTQKEQDLDQVLSERHNTTQKEKDPEEMKKKKVVKESKTASRINKISSPAKKTSDDEQTIESLKSKVDKLKGSEFQSMEKGAFLDDIKDELNRVKITISGSDKRIEALESEVKRREESEAKLFDSFVAQTSQLEQATFYLEKSKLEIVSLKEKMQELEEENQQKREEIERNVSKETRGFVEEIGVLKNKLKLATEAEENSKKALDDLALALKEVATESNQAKENLSLTRQDLDAVTEEAEKLKMMTNGTEETYQTLLNEAKKKNDRLTNTVERLRIEAEESLLAWNEKEIQFVNCIKKADDEKSVVLQESARLLDLVREAEGMNDKSKEENRKLRDILKQALNEASVAKEAAGIAQQENSQLKDSLAEKDKALVALAQETERLHISEAEANESIKQLKKLVPDKAKKDLKSEEKEQKKSLKKEKEKEKEKEDEALTDKEPKEAKKLRTTFSFDLKELLPVPGLTCKQIKDLEDDPETDDALVGSIFDLVDSPTENHDPIRRAASEGMDDGESLNLEGLGQVDRRNFDDMEIERGSQGKRRALLRRFGDLLRRRSPHQQKEITV